jgi:hypothetical protein
MSQKLGHAMVQQPFEKTKYMQLQCLFFPQFCDSAQVAIIQKYV